MRVICERCGHKFSYEKYEGVCNKCGLYQPNYRTNNVADNMINSIFEPLQEAGIEKKLNMSKAHKVVCIVLLFLIVAVPIVTILLTNMEIRYRRQLKTVGVMEPKVYQMNEDILVREDCFRIVKCEVMTEWQDYVPEGFQIVSVQYQKEQEKDWMFAYDTSTYLKLPSNEYIEAISEYSLAQELGYDPSVFIEEYQVTEKMQDLEGRLMFLVPDAIDHASLAVYYVPYSEDREIKVLDSVYEIELDWRN